MEIPFCEDDDWFTDLDYNIIKFMKQRLEKVNKNKNFYQGRKMVSAVNKMIQEIEHAIEAQSMNLSKRSIVLTNAIQISRDAALSKKIFRTKRLAEKLTGIVLDA